MDHICTARQTFISITLFPAVTKAGHKVHFSPMVYCRNSGSAMVVSYSLPRLEGPKADCHFELCKILQLELSVVRRCEMRSVAELPLSDLNMITPVHMYTLQSNLNGHSYPIMYTGK